MEGASVPPTRTLSQDQLVRAIADMGGHYAAILFGAGASRTSGILLAREIVHDLCSEHYCEANGIDPSHRDHVRASGVRQWLEMQQWFAEARDRGESEYSAVFRRFKPTLDHQISYIKKLVAGATPAPAYDGLSRLMYSGVFDLALTTNFDPLLENRYRSLHSTDVIHVLKTSNDFRLATADSGRRQLAYLHGSLDGYSISNLDEHTSVLPPDTDTAVGRLLDQYALLVVGYSGQDASVMGLLARLAQTRPSCFRRGVIYWCHLPGERLSARATELLAGVPQGFTVEIHGFDQLMADLCSRLKIGNELFLPQPTPPPFAATTRRTLPDRAVLNLAPVKQLPRSLFKFRTRLKHRPDVHAFRDDYAYWEATVDDGYLWVLGNPDELPKALRDTCSATPEAIDLASLPEGRQWDLFAELMNAGITRWLVRTIGLRTCGTDRSRYFFPKPKGSDERLEKYMSRRKRTQRKVVWLEFEREIDGRLTRFFAHEAIKVRLVRFQNAAVLRLSPTRLYTIAGEELWTGSKAGVAIGRQVKSIWNAEYDSLVRMWLDILSRGSGRVAVQFSADGRDDRYRVDFESTPIPATRLIT